MKLIALKDARPHARFAVPCWCCSWVTDKWLSWCSQMWHRAQCISGVWKSLSMDTCLSLCWWLESLEQSHRFHPSPTFPMPWKAAWQSACTHAGLNAAAGARMRRNHKLPAQIRPVTHLVLPSGLPSVQNLALKTGTGTGWVYKGNSPLNYTYLVAPLYVPWFKFDFLQRLL